jgi:pimeloyl-ACP methyl ester carboxylesterase
MTRRRILLVLALAGVAVLGASLFVVVRASAELVSPARRPLQDYHREWLEHPASHGISIQNFTACDGRVPCLLVLPDASAGLSPRVERIRRQLEERGVNLPSFGETFGNLVLMPGRNGNKEDLLPVAERFCAVGFRCILPDLPSHGKSPEKICTFGTSDFDASVPVGVLDEAARRFHFPRQPAGLWGMSMGGAYLARAASLPGADWQALVVVCSFDSLDAVLKRKLVSITGPAAPVFDVAIRRACVLRGGVDPAAVQPAKWAAAVSAPLLMAHGTDDELIPETFGRRLFDAYGSAEKRWVSVEGGTHDRVLVTDMPLYATMAEWFLTHLRGPPPLDFRIVPLPRTKVPNSHFRLEVTNPSKADIVLAAVRLGAMRPAPFGPTDTYASSHIQGGSRLFPAFYAELTGDSGETILVGQAPYAERLQRGEWNAYDRVILPPGVSVTCDFPMFSSQPEKAVFHFLRFDGEKFAPVRVSWREEEAE